MLKVHADFTRALQTYKSKHAIAVCVCAGVTEQDKCVADGNVSIMGQRLIYSNRPSDPDEEMTSSPRIRGAGREQLHLLRPSKGDQLTHGTIAEVFKETSHPLHLKGIVRSKVNILSYFTHLRIEHK